MRRMFNYLCLIALVMAVVVPLAGCQQAKEAAQEAEEAASEMAESAGEAVEEAAAAAEEMAEEGEGGKEGQ